jgi:L-aminoadipate-semialdehyde dehydrogenase
MSKNSFHVTLWSLLTLDQTLVRRDKNEEPILVSYIVPELNEWPKFLKTQGLEDIEDEGTDIGPTKVYFKRFRRMQTEVRDHLKGRLPAYAVPTTYVSPEN